MARTARSAQTGSPIPLKGPRAAKLPSSAVKKWLAKFAEQELSGLHPRHQVAQQMANILPQFGFNRVRTALLRAAGIPIGKGALVMGEIYLSGKGDWSELFSIGADTYITGPLRVNLGGSVKIGKGVNIGHDVLLLTVDHQIGPPWRRAGWSEFGPIVIEDGVWIGSRATLLPGVTAGKGSIIAAGAIVTHDVAANTLVGGVPARVLKNL